MNKLLLTVAALSLSGAACAQPTQTLDQDLRDCEALVRSTMGREGSEELFMQRLDNHIRSLPRTRQRQFHERCRSFLTGAAFAFRDATVQLEREAQRR